MGWLYARLKSRYWLVFVAGQAGVSIFVVLLTVAVICSYYDSSVADVVLIAGVACGLTVAAVLWATLRAMPAYNAIVRWRATEAPTPGETVTAWEAATTLTLRQYRSSTGWVNTSVVLPTCVLSVVVLDLPWHAFFVMLLACLIPAVYATVLSYSAGEMLARPLVRDIADDAARRLPVRAARAAGEQADPGRAADLHRGHGNPRRRAGRRPERLRRPGSRRGGGAGHRSRVLVPRAPVLLAQNITEPIGRVRAALARVRAGDLGARVPVTTSDELGELAHDFNLMAPASRSASRCARRSGPTWTRRSRR